VPKEKEWQTGRERERGGEEEPIGQKEGNFPHPKNDTKKGKALLQGKKKRGRELDMCLRGENYFDAAGRRKTEKFAAAGENKKLCREIVMGADVGGEERISLFGKKKKKIGL